MWLYAKSCASKQMQNPMQQFLQSFMLGGFSQAQQKRNTNNSSSNRPNLGPFAQVLLSILHNTTYQIFCTNWHITYDAKQARRLANTLKAAGGHKVAAALIALVVNCVPQDVERGVRGNVEKSRIVATGGSHQWGWWRARRSSRGWGVLGTS